MSQQFQNDSVFWVELEKIKPNPFQPRRDFDPERLNDLAESIRMYGILQPLVVTRHESVKEDGGIVVSYELIAGERRLRASKIAGISQVPVVIRSGDESDQMKLELAIIENLQREDLNPIDRARAFDRLVTDFHFNHSQIGRKIGKSREYVSNSLRLLTLPEEIMTAVAQGKITEGHARPLLMLKDRAEEQQTLYKEITLKQLTVRETESIARRIAHDRIRKKDYGFNPEMAEIEKRLAESLGTRVQIERREVGGKLVIDFFSNEDLHKILELVHSNETKDPDAFLKRYMETQMQKEQPLSPVAPEHSPVEEQLVSEMMGGVSLDDDGDHIEELSVGDMSPTPLMEAQETPVSPTQQETAVEDRMDENLYSVRNFSI